jgi:hypothetical protein
VQVRLFDEDDVEGHALTLHLPTAQAARDLQKKLLAAGIAGIVVVGAATTAMLVPQSGTSQTIAAGPGPAPAVALDSPTSRRATSQRPCSTKRRRPR